MPEQFTIRELADEFDVTTRTLRFYEEKGLLTPTRDGQIRRYSAADRTRLKLIMRGKRLGLSLEESSEIILMYDGGARSQQQLETLIAKIQEKRTQLVQQQQDIDHMLRELESTEVKCIAALKALNKPTA